MPVSTPSLVILGAGPAGLAAAYEAGRRGVPSLVLEAGDSVGGICRTVSRGAYRFDLGGHRFFSKNAEVNELWREVLGEEFLRRPRSSRIYYRQRYFAYPIRAMDAFRGLGPVESALILGSYLRRRIRPHRDISHFENWAANQFGDRLYRHFFKAYTEKVWGLSCREMAAEWGAQRIKGLNLLSALRSALLGSRGGKIKSLIGEFDYPRRGCGQMYDAMADKATAMGADIRTQHRVTRLCREGARIVAVAARAPGGEQVFRCDRVVCSVPIDEAVLGIEPALGAAALEAARSLAYRHLITVNLILEGRESLSDTWIYVHDPRVRMGRFQVFRNWSPDLVPDGDHRALGCEYFASDGDELWTMADGDLIDLAKAEGERLGVFEANRVIDAFVVRVPGAYPVIDLQVRERMVAIRQALREIANLHPVGRNGMFRYNNMDHSILTGLLTVRSIVDGQHRDIWRINADDDYHEEAGGG